MLLVVPAQGKLVYSNWRNSHVWRDSRVILSNQNLACSAGVFFERAICSRKCHVETSRREEEMGRVKGLLFLLSPIFHCHKIKDGGYNNITNTNKVSPTQNTPALQANQNSVFAQTWLAETFICCKTGLNAHLFCSSFCLWPIFESLKYLIPVSFFHKSSLKHFPK